VISCVVGSSGFSGSWGTRPGEKSHAFKAAEHHKKNEEHLVRAAYHHGKAAKEPEGHETALDHGQMP
jgi:hypothetical protein